jgi:hypothetical protein
MSHRSSYENFKRFALYIGEALRNLPRSTIVDPKSLGLGQETFAGRFRDARRAKLVHGFNSPHIDETLFRDKANNLSVRMRDDGHIEIYDHTVDAPPASTGILGSSDPIRFTWADHSEVYALARMIHNKQFDPPLTFLVTIPDYNTFNFTDFDVELVQNGPNEYLLL